jgi:Na+-translocating ferredoxin:NAD+ oxidoreductase RNF subunit RnfB
LPFLGGAARIYDGDHGRGLVKRNNPFNATRGDPPAMQPATDASYRELMDLYCRHPIGGPPSETFVEILKYYFSPEEAHLAAHMEFHELTPGEVIARRAGMASEEASAALTTMASRSWVRGLIQQDGTRVFRLLPIVPGLYEMPFYLREKTPDLERLAALYDTYYREGWGQELHGGKIQISRVLPAHQQEKEQVMPYEDVVKILEQNDRVYSIPCVCRLAYGRCNSSIDVCMSLAGPQAKAEAASHFPIYDPAVLQERHGFREISIDEAIANLDRTEKEGLVHVCSNVQDEPVFICNCCRCCCVLLRSVSDLGMAFGVAPSSYWMAIDDECTGCGLCVDRCPVDAITVSRNQAEVSYDLCLGCGVCAFVCPSEAMRLEKRNQNMFIPPANADEMYTIIGLDRGRAWPVPQHHHH